MSILDDAQAHLGQREIQQISEQIGADPTTTEQAVQAAVPLLLGGVAGTAQQPAQAGAVQSAIQSHSGVLENLGALLGAGPPADGGGLLGRILGNRQSAVQQGVQSASGLDADQTRRLLMALAPIVLAILAKRHANRSSAELGTALQQEARSAEEHVQRTAPHMGGLLGKILNYVETPRA
jgi:hypothetical protein